MHTGRRAVLLRRLAGGRAPRDAVGRSKDGQPRDEACSPTSATRSTRRGARVRQQAAELRRSSPPPKRRLHQGACHPPRRRCRPRPRLALEAPARPPVAALERRRVRRRPRKPRPPGPSSRRNDSLDAPAAAPRPRPDCVAALKRRNGAAMASRRLAAMADVAHVGRRRRVWEAQGRRSSLWRHSRDACVRAARLDGALRAFLVLQPRRPLDMSTR